MKLAGVQHGAPVSEHDFEALLERKPGRLVSDKWRPLAMEMKVFVKAALRKVAQKVGDGSLDKHEEGYDDPEEMLLDWIWIELKEESPDKDAVINMELDDLYEVIESSAELYEDYQILLETIRTGNS